MDSYELLKSDERYQRICLFNSAVRSLCNEMKGLVSMLEDHLESAAVRVKQNIADEMEKYEGEEKEFMEGNASVFSSSLIEEYPKIMRRSLFVAAMGMFEKQLVALCNECHQCFNFSVKFKYKKNRVRLIVQAISYLQDNLQLTAHRYCCYFSEIEDFWTIRNSLVHDDGKIKVEEVATFKNFCRSISTINIDNGRNVVLEKGSVDIAIHTIDLFFLCFLEEIKRNIR